jgi:AraC-like DNA-binding protein
VSWGLDGRSLGRFGARVSAVGSYLERAPVPALAGVVRTVWVQRTGDVPYVQRHLPTGGVEIHFPIGGRPQVVGPLTRAMVEVIPARTTIVGVRFLPGGAPSLSVMLDELVDQRVPLSELWGGIDRLGEAMMETPERALGLLQRHLVQCHLRTSRVDSLVGAAVWGLMPWRPVDIGALASQLGLSVSQLRRRCLQAVGTTPKVLQRILRFQGFLALAQAGIAASDGVAGLAGDVGYADQAHLSRECLRLAGVTPRQLLGGDVDRCGCGHDHSASYRPFLAGRMRDSFKTDGVVRS